ncbi:RNA exonuclease 4 [Scheffersomyces xylosifermentans]|uniref:RNA exonuclease 4 n=1 Tax=Scheffersomyces xylosifermentans TaxID=1304137 RepID=UPI00315D55C5
MAELSSNWKKLSSKLEKKSSKPRTPVKSGASTGKIKATKSSTLTPAAEAAVSSVTTPAKSGLTPIEYALWSKENDITTADIESAQRPNITLTPQGNDIRKKEPGKYLSMDCEFVGVGPEGTESALARVSIVNFYGHTVLDEFVKPREKVTDWRTWVSGVTPKHMNEAITFEEAQKKTADLLQDRILVGHAIHHDLDSLFLSHPKAMIRDTSKFQTFKAISNGRTPSLKKLTSHFLKLDIQGAAHSSVEDARATMLLFRLYRKDFEKSLRLGRNRK